MPYFVYMLLCQDDSFYTGITVDVSKRLQVHLSGRGAKYTRSHRPIRVVYQQEFPDKGSALRAEHELKQLSHAQKSQLVYK